MSSILPELQTKLERLSPEQQAAVAAFVDDLLSQAAPKSRPKMKLDWAGGLRHLRDEYTSVELQHEANKWREEKALAYLNQREE
jgi:hypothetical protein